MWSELNVEVSADPRCPEVPNETRCAGTEGSGRSAKYAVTSRATSTRSCCCAGCPARGCTDIRPPPPLDHRSNLAAPPRALHSLGRPARSGRDRLGQAQLRPYLRLDLLG